MQQFTQPTPDLFWQTMSGYQQSAALKAAVELNIFTAIADGSRTAGEIAQVCGASERGTRILCDALTVMGFLTKTGNEYSPTESTAIFLNRKSPAYLGSALDFIMSPYLRHAFDDLSNAVRNGGAPEVGNDSLGPESPMWVTFAKAMMPLMFPPAQRIADQIGFDADKEIKVLDIAAGHGIFGITVAQKYPNAQIYAADWANVLTVATENAQKFAVGDRHHLIPGSAFDTDFGEGYDVVLVTNFLHHFDPPTNEKLLKKINAALKEDGKVMTLEFVPNDDRVSPPTEAMFSLVMLADTPAGDAYTFAELKTMFEHSGFSRNEHIPLTPLPQHLVVSMK
jgi:SAM-dependent methyltransferase